MGISGSRLGIVAAHWSRSNDARLLLGKWMLEEKAKEGKASNDG